MSALARFFAHQGWEVAGYDRVETVLTKALEEEGIAVHYDDSVELIPEKFRDIADKAWVVYTPAVPKDHSELCWFEANGFEVKKRSQVLGLLAKDKYTMAVAGTHGKTTTTTMVAYFNTIGAGEGSAFLGGLSKNFGSNIVMGEGDRLAVEADEFDRSFLQLYPNVAVITSTDADHLDIYGSHDHVLESFELFADQVSDVLVVREGLELSLSEKNHENRKVFTYAVDSSTADYYACNLRAERDGCYSFDMVMPGGVLLDNLKLGVPGRINVENCVAAVALVSQAGYTESALREAITTFSGVVRRFDVRVNCPKCLYMDDYAHHPTELRAMLESVHAMFPGRRITIAFQPHLYSRTRDFWQDFAASLDIADRVILLPIYPARELPIEGVTSEIIFDALRTSDKILLNDKSDLIDCVQNMTDDLDIFITAGAGDIDTLCGEVQRLLSANC